MAPKPIFTIGAEDGGADVLLLEFGPDYCCYAWLNEAERKFSRIVYFALEELRAEEQVAAILESLEKTAPKKLIACSGYFEALLLPQKYASTAASLLDAVYEPSSQEPLADRVPEWQMTAAFRFPPAIARSVKEYFPSAIFLHAYTPSLKIYNGFVAPDQIDIHFTPGYFRVLLKKNKELQLAQTYAYKTPLDVVYYLLKICYEFALDQKEVFLVLSGLVEKDSALYAELHAYFLNLHFAQAPAYAMPEHEHPHYYFTSLYNLAACVS